MGIPRLLHLCWAWFGMASCVLFGMQEWPEKEATVKRMREASPAACAKCAEFWSLIPMSAMSFSRCPPSEVHLNDVHQRVPNRISDPCFTLKCRGRTQAEMAVSIGLPQGGFAKVHGLFHPEARGRKNARPAKHPPGPLLPRPRGPSSAVTSRPSPICRFWRSCAISPKAGRPLHLPRGDDWADEQCRSLSGKECRQML